MLGAGWKSDWGFLGNFTVVPALLLHSWPCIVPVSSEALYPGEYLTVTEFQRRVREPTKCNILSRSWHLYYYCALSLLSPNSGGGLRDGLRVLSQSPLKIWIYCALSKVGLLEWDKLAQNPALAFYQNWPWLCPKYSVSQSLDLPIRHCEPQIVFLDGIILRSNYFSNCSLLPG